MTYQNVGELLGKDHSNIVYASNKAMTQVDIGNLEYSVSMLNWRAIFNDNEIGIKKDTNKKEILRSKILALINDALAAGILTISETDDLLTSMLKNKKAKG